MSQSRLSYRRALRAGLPAGLAVMGISVAGIGTALAASQGETSLDNIPAETGILKIEFETGSFPCHVGPFTSGIDPAPGAISPGQGFTVTPYGDSTCVVATTGGGVGYRFNADDRTETGLDCRRVLLSVGGAGHDWINCGV